MENWKSTTRVYRKNILYKPEVSKISTKACTQCGNTNLLLFATLNLKTCTDCGIDIPWYIEPNQKALL